MKGTYTFALLLVIPLAIVSFLLFLVRHSTIAIFHPQGTIAFQERNLMIIAALLMLLVVIPLFVLTFAIVWRYRAENTTAKYTPNWDHDTLDEFIWWGVPLAIIVVLAVLTWQSTHALDPFRPLSSTTPPITIEVVALNWKWLFIYPSLGIATVNFVEFPEQTPVNFEVTADAPMNSFWIPQLGGQIYAMTGMVTQLHLMADDPGDYTGVSSNFSGAGFSGMTFTARSVSNADFAAWVTSVQKSPQILTPEMYRVLEEPSENTPATYYASTTQDLFDTIVMKFMTPMGVSQNMQMQGMSQ
jgi:cytochrome o ubiquinol oxidase subunit II